MQCPFQQHLNGRVVINNQNLVHGIEVLQVTLGLQMHLLTTRGQLDSVECS